MYAKEMPAIVQAPAPLPPSTPEPFQRKAVSPYDIEEVAIVAFPIRILSQDARFECQAIDQFENCARAELRIIIERVERISTQPDCLQAGHPLAPQM